MLADLFYVQPIAVSSQVHCSQVHASSIESHIVTPNMDTTCAPFTLQKMVVLGGGHLQGNKKLMLPCEVVENKNFTSIKKTNISLRELWV